MSSTIAPETLSSLIGSIYDCALDPGHWPATLTEMRRALSFHNAALGLHAIPTGELLLNVTSGIEAPWLERMPHYGPDVVEQWGGAAAVAAYPLDEPIVLSQQRSYAQMEANRYFIEWAKPQGLVDVLAIGMARDSTMVGSIGLGRHVSDGAIGRREVDAARLLVPHVQRAVAISKVLDMKAVAAASFAATLDALAAAVVLVDADLRIVHANQAAEGMLRVGDPVASERGVLALRSPAANAALALSVRQAALDEAAIGRRGFGIPAPRADGEPCVLHVMPLKRGSLRPGLRPNAAAAVFVAPALAPAPAPNEAVAALFDLTAAEARVFSQIASGLTPSQTASRLGIGDSTVKTHLLRLFAKTGTRRQSDLVKLAASLAMPS